jgi:hypothetical protein
VPQLPAWTQPSAWTNAAQSLFASAADRGMRALSEVRRQVSLDLATRHDVEVQGRMTRKTLAHTLNQFLDSQAVRDEQLIDSVKAEIRELLENVIAALDEDMYEEPIEAALVDDNDDIDIDAEDRRLDLVSLDDIDFEAEEAALNYE